MTRSPYILKYTAVVLSFVLAVAFGSVLQSVRSIQDPVQGIPIAGGEKERDETVAVLVSHVRSSGAASPKAERVDAGDPVQDAVQFGPHAVVKFPHQIPLPRNFSGYFDEQKDAAGRESEHEHSDRAGSQVKPPESGRRKRSTDSSIKDDKDNGDHPLPEEHGAKVHWWNDARPCHVVLLASEVAKHFPHECQHPLSCNITFLAIVPCHDVCARLNSGCTEHVLHAVPETQLGAVQNETKQLALFEKTFERRLGELDSKLAQLSSKSKEDNNKLVEVPHNLNYLIEALQSQMAAASKNTSDSVDRNAAEMKALFNTTSESMMTSISSLFSLVQSDTRTHLWTLKEYSEKKAEAIKNGWSSKMSEKVYVGRYLISWGIEFISSARGVYLHLSFQLHKGISDEFLEWPFSKALKLSLIHPESGNKREGRVKPGISAADMKFYGRPLEGSNEPVYFSSFNFDSSYIEHDGYVKTDQLRLKLEMPW